jgi:hypothetical protein
MKDLGLTSKLRIGSILQLGQHDIEGLNGFIIALCATKRRMLQLVSNMRLRIEFDDLSIIKVSIWYENVCRHHHTFCASKSASSHSIFPSITLLWFAKSV